MSVVIQDNFSLAAAKAVDNRYEKVTSGGTSVPYANTSEALTAIPLVYRHIGLTVAIDNGSGGATEYWFKDNTTTLVPKGGAVANADNGLSLTTGYVKLGGALTQATTNITGSNQSLNFYLNSDANDRYTQFLSNKFFGIIQSGDLPNAITSSGSMSRLVIFKSTGGIWTNNYSSNAYEAQTRFLQQYPWTNNPSYNPSTGTPTPPPLDDAHSFQIYDDLISTNQSSALISHYYDERVGSSNWQETYTSNFGNLTIGKVYTLRTKATGDNFPSTLALSTKSGSANTTGWVFVYSGNASGAIWTNGSIIDGDFPKITNDPKFSIVSCQVGDSPGDYAGLGTVYIRGNGLLINSVIDQRASTTRGLLLGRFTTGTRPKSSVVPLKQGELFYNASANRLEFFISASSGNDTWGVVTNTTTTYPSS